MSGFLEQGIAIGDVVSHMYQLAHIQGDPDDPLSVPMAFNGVLQDEWPRLSPQEDIIETYQFGFAPRDNYRLGRDVVGVDEEVEGSDEASPPG
ncbi:hypothetical protein ABW21_db0206758 [Orbilia brochopaga]|nr:hypothetical protein ABW21_db0206758 [Drechslerella brochopaga]